MALKALFYPDVKFETLFIPYIYKEIYFEGIYNDITNGQTEMTVIDCGANIGVVTQYLRDFSKKVYAIEPSTKHFEALKQNKEFNNWDNVEIFNLAIADKDGEMTLNTNNQNLTCNSLKLDYGQGGETVKTQTFKTFFDENKIEKVDFLKFDVEGSEDMIIFSQGFKDVVDKIQAIEIEFHFPSYPEIVKYLISLGFKARQYQSSAVVILFYR